MNEQIKNTKKNYEIQFLRGFFCLVIIFFHFTFRYAEIYGSSNIFYNNVIELFAPFGVISFFVISGFYVIPRKNLASFKDKVFYWIKRFLSIYSVYLVSIVIIFFCLLTGLAGEERTVSFGDFIKNLFFINIFTRGSFVDGSHWYVFALLCLFLIVAFCDLLPINKKAKMFLLTVVLALSCVSLVVVKYVDAGYRIVKLCKLLNVLLLQGYYPYAYIGISLFFFDYDHIGSKNNLFLVLSNVFSLVSVGISNWVYLLVTLVSVLIVILALFKKMVFLEKIKPIVFLGNASYSTYLLHQNIGYILLIILSKVMNYYIALPLTIMAVLLIGFTFYYLIERNLKKAVSLIGQKHQEQTKTE